MRFTLTASVLAFAASVLAADATSFDPISKPAVDETIPAGETYTIKWSAQPAKNKGDTITIKWYSGTSPQTLTEKGNVATGVKNADEQFNWKVPANLGSDKFYGLRIFSDNDQGATEWSGRFHIKGNGNSESSGDSTGSSATSGGSSNTGSASSGSSASATSTTVVVVTSSSTEKNKTSTAAPTTMETKTSAAESSAPTSAAQTTAPSSAQGSNAASTSAASASASAPTQSAAGNAVKAGSVGAIGLVAAFLAL